MSGGRRSRSRRLLSAIGPVLVLLALAIALRLVVGDRFLAPFNLCLILTQTVLVAVGALGMTMVIVAGGIDISCGSAMALCAVLSARVLEADAAGWHAVAAIAAAIAGGAAVGALNGAIIAGLRMPPFIVTLGMLGIARGLAKGLARESTVSYAPTWINRLMQPRAIDADPAWQRALAIAPGVWIAAALALSMMVVMRRTVFGRRLYAIGSNEAGARLCGIRVERTAVATYAAAGAFFGLAGLLSMAKLNVGDSTGNSGMELDVIAATVIGGASLSGGVGSIVGSLIGALIMAVLRNGSQQLGWPNYMQEIIIGLAIVVAVAMDRWRSRVGTVGG